MEEFTFAERLSVLRKRKGLTMRKLGEYVNCAASDLYRLEHGLVKNPSAHRVADLAKVLGVTMDELWHGQK